MNSEFSIETRNLKRIFKLDRTARKEIGKTLIALEGVNLQVRHGEIFGLLGPNGAGKTTCIRILCTLLSPSSGVGLVDGFDVDKDIWKVRRIINMISGGETSGYGILTPRENLRLFTELYGIPWKIAKPRVEKMLKVVGLSKFKGVRVNKLSTGMRQRLNFARGFTTDPKVLFMDEPTVGLDVHSAIEIRSFIKQWMAENPEKTILLTTHYMAEADELCDRIAIIDNGNVQVCDTPDNLKKLVKNETSLILTLSGVDAPPDSWSQLPGIVELTSSFDAENQTTQIRVLLESHEASGNIIAVVTADGRRLIDLRAEAPTLEDVFLKLTGRSLSEDTAKLGAED